jgi:hypothetical protein
LTQNETVLASAQGDTQDTYDVPSNFKAASYLGEPLIIGKD